MSSGCLSAIKAVSNLHLRIRSDAPDLLEPTSLDRSIAFAKGTRELECPRYDEFRDDMKALEASKTFVSTCLQSQTGWGGVGRYSIKTAKRVTSMGMYVVSSTSGFYFKSPIERTYEKGDDESGEGSSHSSRCAKSETHKLRTPLRNS